MKILWLSHFLLYPETGSGALQRSRNLLIQLSRCNDIYLVSYFRDTDLTDSLTLQKAKYDLLKYCKGVKFIPHPHNKRPLKAHITFIRSFFSSKPYSALIHESKSFLHEAMAILKTREIDLVYSDTLGLFEPIIDKIQLPRIINHHNIESQMMFRRAGKENQPLKRMVLYIEALKLRAYERNYCHKYHRNIVVSDLDRKRLLTINNKTTIDVIENGVDCHYFKYYPRQELRHEIIFVSSLHWYANIDAVIYFCKDIWPLLLHNIADIRLTVVGKNPDSRLDRIVSKYPDIKITGFVPDVREYIRKASIFVCPIRDGGGTKLKILDAMAQGIPIVSSSLGCEGIDVTDGENIYIANEPQEYLSKIAKLINDLNEQNRIAFNAYHLIKKRYCYELIGSKFNQIIADAKMGETACI